MVEVTKREIDLSLILKTISGPEAGAVSVFIGTTRNHSDGRQVQGLDYEAYEPMALKVMAQLEEEARRRWPLHGVAMVHRSGKVAIGEASVVIAVASAHRSEAFEACRFLIDRLKEVVPIWKRERFADGTTEWAHRSGAATVETGESA